jgi:hypothetical protein
MDFKVIECEDVDQTQGPVVESCKHVNVSSDPTKLVVFLDQLSDCQLLQKDSAPRGLLFIIRM